MWRENLRFDHGAQCNWRKPLALDQKWRDTSNNETTAPKGGRNRSPNTSPGRRYARTRSANALPCRLNTSRTVGIAARLHDEGKEGVTGSAPSTSNTMPTSLFPASHLPRHPRFNWALLDGYRHEFDSLPYREDDPEVKTSQRNCRISRYT